MASRRTTFGSFQKPGAFIYTQTYILLIIRPPKQGPEFLETRICHQGLGKVSLPRLKETVTDDFKGAVTDHGGRLGRVRVPRSEDWSWPTPHNACESIQQNGILHCPAYPSLKLLGGEDCSLADGKYLPGLPVARIYGLFRLSTGLLCGIVSCNFGLLGFPVQVHLEPSQIDGT